MNQQRPQLPNVSSALGAWGQTLEFIVVARELIDHETVETRITCRVKGVRVPFKAQAIQQRPIGERAWRWETVFASPSVVLKIGDEIIFGIGETRYRIMERRDWSEYGYIEYDICQGFESV